MILAQVFGALYGMLAVVFGAFGAHALKKTFTVEQLQSFETGVKYQMYHAIVLLVVGFNFDGSASIQNYIVYSYIIGVFLFSFSIYGLCISASKNKKIKILGPITPLGGLFLVAGWALLLVHFL
ncbi:DUF423 domain-containing protein [Cellulophaga baltica]|uniref:DUF423 domain-containing protein n=1 Tax=Cellulophaga TaxID=104264 RepID=UPI001C07167F|nr:MULTISPECIES: DUF423 domain-containing protein [Cellulophaga]MBU2997695.1 DUF423 domain-containing protein [Cellulophaga baltica]MDO6769090.1 DUF423 domain-containing protein [Cellulophaga sp. 1_MG-2023]